MLKRIIACILAIVVSMTWIVSPVYATSINTPVYPVNLPGQIGNQGNNNSLGIYNSFNNEYRGEKPKGIVGKLGDAVIGGIGDEVGRKVSGFVLKSSMAGVCGVIVGVSYAPALPLCLFPFALFNQDRDHENSY